jgi:hypothetical protein
MRQQLAQWDFTIPTVVISFDWPDEKVPFDDQIQRALQMAPGKKNFIREILLENIIQRVHRLAEFDIIGVTEKEVGKSIIERMQKTLRSWARLSQMQALRHQFTYSAGWILSPHRSISWPAPIFSTDSRGFAMVSSRLRVRASKASESPRRIRNGGAPACT